VKVVRSIWKSGSDVIEPVRSVVRVENVGSNRLIENDESAESVESDENERKERII
jgi:hypothetical protein